MMIRRSIFGSISQYQYQYQYQYLHNSTICSSSATNPPPSPPPPPPLSRVATLVEGCDYEHWLVVVEPPKGYPLRTQILNDYIKTLAIALGSEEEAKKSIYSVSTKYYYAFGCKIPENLTHKIKSLPSVRWVLPDSYLCHSENDCGVLCCRDILRDRILGELVDHMKCLLGSVSVDSNVQLLHFLTGDEFFGGLIKVSALVD